MAKKPFLDQKEFDRLRATLDNVASGKYSSVLQERRQKINEAVDGLLTKIQAVEKGEASLKDVYQAGSEVEQFLLQTMQYSGKDEKAVKVDLGKVKAAKSSSKGKGKGKTKKKAPKKPLAETLQDYMAKTKADSVTIDKLSKETGYSTAALAGCITRYWKKQMRYDPKQKMVYFTPAKPKKKSAKVPVGQIITDYFKRRPRLKSASIYEIAEESGLEKSVNLIARVAQAHPKCRYNSRTKQITYKRK
jgi:hypothetical protein